MKKLTLLFMFICVVQASVQDDVKDLDDRLFSIEKMLKGKSPALPYDASLLQIGGAIVFDYEFQKSEEWKTDAGNNRQQLTRGDIFIGGNINDKMSYLLVPTWWHVPVVSNSSSADRETTGRADVVNLYRARIQYNHNRYVNFKLGRYIAPVGIYLETYAPSADRISFPQSLDNAVPGGLMFDSILDGINFYGTANIGPVRTKYYVYGGVQSLSQANYATSTVAEKLGQGYPKNITFGGRVSAGYGPVDIGFNVQKGNRLVDFTSFGADMKLNFGRLKINSEFQLTSEGDKEDRFTDTELTYFLGCYTLGAAGGCGFLRSYYTGSTATAAGDARILSAALSAVDDYVLSRLDSTKRSFYVEPTFQLTDKILLVSRYDWFDGNSIAFDNDGAKTVVSLGVNYMPVKNLRLKAIFQRHDYEHKTGGGSFRGNDTLIGGFASLAGRSSSDAVNAAAADPSFNAYTLSAILSF